MNFAPKLIIGLGNPGPEHKNTYHNVGHLFIQYLEKQNLHATRYTLLTSNAYMNESGRFVAQVMKKNNAKSDELLIVHDDSDLTLGTYKLQFGRGSAGHHGVESVQTVLKTKDFWRLRIGIRPSPAKALAKEGRRKKASEFVLKKISKADMALLEKTFEEILKTL